MYKEYLEEITHVVSLGPNCMVAYQVRRFLLIGTSYPFDWWVTPFGGLIKTLEHLSVEDLFNENKLQIVNSGDSVSNPDYDILYHHDFDRIGPDGNLHPGASGNVHFDIQSQLAIVRKKYDHVYNNFCELNKAQNSVLFVRLSVDQDERQKLINALGRVFNHCNFSLLSISPKDNGVWSGNDLEWDGIFHENLIDSRYKKRVISL
jgi:hypothetical protein